MTKRASGAILDVGLTVDSTTPRYRQLYEGLRESILMGRVAPGTRLPSTRTLAAEVGCSRNTVMSAFDQLTAEGYLEARVGAGTRVATALPEAAVAASHVTRSQSQRSRPRRSLSRRARLILGSQHVRLAPPNARPFRIGVPARDVFPTDVWARLLARWARQMPALLFEYGDAAGYRPLREAIAAYLREARAVRCDPEQVIVVAGSQQGIDLIARLLLDPGDLVCVEDPCYPPLYKALIAAGARVRPIPVDADGLDVRAALSRAFDAKLIYVTPSHQFPLGVTMSLERRIALLSWAAQSGAWILEDDHNSEYRYTSRPLASLQGLDTAGRVIYMGTFSKVLFPGLRLGYVVVPPDLVDPFLAARMLTDRHSCSVSQAALADFITEGHFTRHIRRSRMVYAERQAALIEATQHLAGDLDISPSDAGMHLIAWLATRRDDSRLAVVIGKHGVEVAALSVFRLRSRGRGGLLLGYAGYTGRELREAAKKLEGALRAASKDHPATFAAVQSDEEDAFLRAGQRKPRT